MHGVIKTLALMGGLLAAACQTTLRPTTDYDPSVDFSTFETFSWIDPNPLIRVATQRPLSPLVEQRLMSETRAALTRSGLRFAEDPLEADLAVAFTIGSREGIRITSYPTRSFHRGLGGRRHTWQGYWTTSTVRTRQYTEGQLAVDLFDVKEMRPVWHGTVSRRVTRQDRNEPDEIVRAVVEAILDRFPPG